MTSLLIDSAMIDQLQLIAKNAGNAIMEVYNSDFDIEFKDDKSPLTVADKKSNKIITNGLEKLTLTLPILSEEGLIVDYKERYNWQAFWLIDPLDGTKEFIKKNNEFTVNIALMINNNPIFGVVYAPALDIMFWGGEGFGAYKSVANGTDISIYVKKKLDSPIKIATSRSHPSSQMNNFLSQFNNFSLHSIGSSLKLCAVADGTVHLYPRLGPTMEWDTAASHAIVKAAGGEVRIYGTDEPVKYNKKELLNPEFLVANINFFQNIK